MSQSIDISSMHEALHEGKSIAIHFSIADACARLRQKRPIHLVDNRLGTKETIATMSDFTEWVTYLDWRYPGHDFTGLLRQSVKVSPQEISSAYPSKDDSRIVALW